MALTKVGRSLLNTGVADSSDATAITISSAEDATFAGHILLADSKNIKLGAGTDLQLYHDGTNSYITNSTGALKIATETSGIAVTIGHTTSETTIADNLTVTGTVAAGVITADGLDMGDSEKIRLGAAQDLEIYHDGSHSYIYDGGTGNIVLKTNNGANVDIMGASEYMAKFIKDGAVELYYNDAKKLETTAAGITVTGAVTGNLTGDVTGDVTGNVSGTAATVTTAAQTNITSLGTLTALTGGTGDFNWDSGTLFVDSSANAVGIGETTPDAPLHITSNTPIIVFDESDASQEYRIGSFGGTFALYDSTDSAYRLAVDGDGKIGIGETAPLAKLHIKLGDSGLSSLNAAGDHIFLENSGANGTGITLASGNTANGSIIFGDEDSNYRGVLIYDHSADAMKFVTAGSERMRIGSTGKTSWSAGGIGAVATQSRDFTFYTEGSTNGVDIRSNDYQIAFIGGAGSSGAGMDKGYMQLCLDGSAKIAFNTDGASYFNGGNLGIGETDPHEKVHVTGASGVALLMHMDADTADGTSAVLFKNDSTNDDRRIKAGIIYQRDDPGTRGTGDLHFCVNGANSDTNVSVSDSRLAIHADGNIHTKSLFVDTTTDNSVSNDDGIVLSDGAYQVIRRSATMLYLHHTAGSGTGTLVAINKAQATVGTITATNSNAAYNTSSDYRLKENVDYTWDATTRLKQLKPARFNWVIDSTNTLQDGFMAHEVQSIVPEAVTGTKDAVWSAEEEANGEGIEGEIKGQQMDHSKLVPLLVKTIQELEARIKTLEDA